MWKHYQITGGGRFQYNLHNTEIDYFDAAHIQVSEYGGRQFVQVAMPLLRDTPQVDYATLAVREIKVLPTYNKDIQAAKAWFKEIYHYLRHQKELFKFTKIVGTAWRTSQYKEFTLFCGRRLQEPLIRQGWKHETTSVVVVSKNDFYMRGCGEDYKYLTELAHAGNTSVLPVTHFWENKDKYKLRG